MNRLSKKFTVGIAGIILISSFCSIWFNTQFIGRFYLYQKRTAITEICGEFTGLLQQGTSPQDAMEHIESSYKVVIAEVENGAASDNDMVNAQIQSAFQEKGIGFQKYWFWEEDYKKVIEGENRIRLYQQEKLNYSLLIDYIRRDSDIYAITMIVPNIKDAFRIANRFLIAVNAFTIFIAIIFIILLIKKITGPLHLFGDFAGHMQNNEFVPIEIHTNDELEEVAGSLNSMGNQIMQFQQSLQEKNAQMEQLLDNVAHDLKTPISLIQLYANGIKDGIDDGTFLDTVLYESHQMSNMADRLLYLSRIGKEQYHSAEINLSDTLTGLIAKYSILAEENQMEIHTSIEKDIVVTGAGELLQSLLLNLITNAVKYSSGKEITVTLFKQNHEAIFTIMNETDNDILDINKIWAPYYVGEQSRSKKLSGTGLGLNIVQKICEAQNYSLQCSMQKNRIIFTVAMPILQL